MFFVWIYSPFRNCSFMGHAWESFPAKLALKSFLWVSKLINVHGALIRIALLFLCFFVYPNFFLDISSLPNNYFCTTSFLYTATTMGKLASSTICFFFVRQVKWYVPNSGMWWFGAYQWTIYISQEVCMYRLSNVPVASQFVLIQQFCLSCWFLSGPDWLTDEYLWKRCNVVFLIIYASLL